MNCLGVLYDSHVSIAGDDSEAHQVSHGFLRVAQLLRHDGYRARENHGLSVTQAQLIALVDARGPLRVGQIAHELGVTSASVSDSVRALHTKGLVVRTAAPDDRRATLIGLSDAGRLVAPQVGESIARLVDAVAALPEETRGALLGALVDLIGEMEDAGMIAPARMCTTCEWFVRDAHPGEERPNHCRFIDRPLGPADLRIECPDHRVAEERSLPIT